MMPVPLKQVRLPHTHTSADALHLHITNSHLHQPERVWRSSLLTDGAKPSPQPAPACKLPAPPPISSKRVPSYSPTAKLKRKKHKNRQNLPHIVPTLLAPTALPGPGPFDTTRGQRLMLHMHGARPPGPPLAVLTRSQSAPTQELGTTLRIHAATRPVHTVAPQSTRRRRHSRLATTLVKHGELAPSSTSSHSTCARYPTCNASHR